MAENFRSWQRDTVGRGILPVIAVAGGRGKSTVVRMLDSIFQAAHLRTATWTNLGVEIRGRRQRGELSGWSLALSRLADSTIDVAIQELHASTVNAVGLPEASYPVAILTNVSGPAGTSSSGEQMRRAALRMARAVHPDGVCVVNGDDPAIADIATGCAGVAVVTSLSDESPFIRAHLDDGGSGAWLEQSFLLLGEAEATVQLDRVDAFSIALGGSAAMQVSNLLSAASTAFALGVDMATIAGALRDFLPAPENLPGSFNVFDSPTCTAYVDSLTSTATLRSVLRAANPGGKRRQLTVVGNLSGFALDDVNEVGRLLGRHQGAIILHSNTRSDILDAFRRGISANRFPPVVIHLPTERRALNRALKTVRPEDILLILHQGEPEMALRAVGRFMSQPGINE